MCSLTYKLKKGYHYQHRSLVHENIIDTYSGSMDLIPLCYNHDVETGEVLDALPLRRAFETYGFGRSYQA